MVKAACDRCGEPFTSQRSTARFCSSNCRKRANEGKPVDRVAPHVLPSGAPALSVQSAVAAVRSELEAAGRVDTYLGATALALAERIDSSTAVMGFAALAKELRSTMSEALAGAKVAADPVDEVRARRDRVRAAGRAKGGVI